MLARRLLALIALLLVLLAIANAIAPRQGKRSTTNPGRGDPTRSLAAPRAQPAPLPRGGTVTAELSASQVGRTRTVRARVGDLIDLTVSAAVPGTVEISGYDQLAPVDPTTPAEFQFFADRSGTFEVRLHDSGAVVGRLRVQPGA